MDEVAQKIAAEIRARGVIPFARFMELALYCPVYGYYEKEKDTIGRQGDYFTSVSVGPLFGELLAFQFAEWMGFSPPIADHRPQAPGPGPQDPGRGLLQIVEAGAHEGQLARDILGWLRQERPELFSQLEYWIVEPSTRGQERQRRKLESFAGTVRWVKELGPMHCGQVPDSKARNAAETRPLDRVRGIIFSNELLDAMPVHRVGWEAGKQRWFEWGVTLEHERFVWARMDLSLPWPVDSGMQTADGGTLAGLGLRTLEPYLPDGFTLDVCPAAAAWWRQAAEALERGKLLTLDYGFTAEEWVRPERSQGTLRAYRGHEVTHDLLAEPGRQDLTAHVDFTAIQAAGEALGLHTESFLTQAQFLTRIAARVWEGPGDWTPERRRQFQTLIHPEHLGRAFRVLVQERPAYGEPNS